MLLETYVEHMMQFYLVSVTVLNLCYVTKFNDKTIKGNGRETKKRKVRTESTIMHLATIVWSTFIKAIDLIRNSQTLKN